MCVFPPSHFFFQLEDEETDVGGEEGEPSHATYSAQQGRGCRGGRGVESGWRKIVGMVFLYGHRRLCVCFLEYTHRSISQM